LDHFAYVIEEIILINLGELNHEGAISC